MPAIPSDSKVFLTGGTGYIGIWILKTLLEQGFTVRAAVRKEEKAAYLKEKFQNHADQLEFTIIEDLLAPGAFDEALKGILGVIHTASPVVLTQDAKMDPSELTKPAVDGTLALLNSAAKSPSVQRIVLTSSIVAIWEPKPSPAVYTEDDWNVTSAKIVEEQGREASVSHKYRASKYRAEKAAWDWMRNLQPSFDLVTVLPSYTWGQVLNESTADIKATVQFLLNPLKKSALEALESNREVDRSKLLQEWQIVDVRDVAAHHVQALLHPEAGENRFLTCAGNIILQHVFDILNANPVEGIIVPKGDPDVLKDWVPSPVFSNKKIKEVLGVSYIPIEETVRESILRALELGWSQ